MRHSSAYDANQCGHLVVDGSMDTYWESFWDRKNPTQPQWLQMEMNATDKLQELVIHWGVNHAKTYSISGLNKHNEWETLHQSSQGVGGRETITLDNVQVSALKLMVEDFKDPFRGCIINEIEVFGEGKSRFLPARTVKLSRQQTSLNDNLWRVQNASLIKNEPDQIASAKYNDTNWIPASVPGTILNDYYQFGALPDPLYGDDVHQISDGFFSGNNFWYRKTLDFDANLKGNRLFLDFSGINWKSKVYFNGKYLGKIDGGFHRGEFEVTDLINFDEPNALAVLVIHNENWVSGEFKVIQKELGDPTTNGDMLGLDGPTSLASAGWNWLPIIPGRNNGIWNNVNLRVRKQVSIEDSWFSSRLNLPDTSRAELTFRTTLKNHSDEKLSGKLSIAFGNRNISVPIDLEPNEVRDITLDKGAAPELLVENPRLWWPNGYGNPELYEAEVKFETDYKVSDQERFSFGVRQLDYKVVEDVLFVYCNGVRVLLKGGNWGLPEALMRVDSAGYDLRLRLHREANFNMIRNWIGMTNHEEFYDACDRHGVLIFDDFWLANPKNGPDPRDFDLFMSNVRDKIKWVRRHPSLAFYCGRNEGLPPINLDLAMQSEVEKLDGTRYYVPHSAAGTVSGFGPYDVREVDYYFRKRGYTLHSEQGIIAFPEPESMRRMMKPEDLWPVSDTWAKHNYQTGRSEKFTETITERFGKPQSMEDYSRRAQLWNYESGKAMFECLQSNQGSGMLLWMSQSAWPSLICQLYDHYFEYTASYFAVKKATSPIHVFWDKDQAQIRVANNTNNPLRGIQVNAKIYSAKGQEVWSNSKSMDVDPTSALTAFDMADPYREKVHFMKLEMLQGKKVLASNFYWIENESGHCLDLNDLPDSEVKLKVNPKNEENIRIISLELKNTSNHWSLLNKIKLKDKATGESILPVFFDDDYVSLMPGEKRVITMRVDNSQLKGKTPVLYLEGWNTITTSTEL
ncbi:MAG: discoidin domain-containing protein [Cyclobacteriaceae bacterium]